jgi:hypothetical protein
MAANFTADIKKDDVINRLISTYVIRHAREADLYCLDDLARYFPEKRVYAWKDKKKTFKLIAETRKQCPAHATYIVKYDVDAKKRLTWANWILLADFALFCSEKAFVKVLSDSTIRTL